MQKPNLQTILISILIVVALFASCYLPCKFKQLSNDFLNQTNQYGELLKQINDLQKEVRDLKDGDVEVEELPDEKLEEDETNETNEIIPTKVNASDLSSKVPLEITEDWKTYRNEEYGFDFDYPFQMTFKLYEELSREGHQFYRFDESRWNRLEYRTFDNFKKNCLSNAFQENGKYYQSPFSHFQCRYIDTKNINYYIDQQINFLQKIENGTISDDFLEKLKNREEQLEIFSGVEKIIRKINIDNINGLEIYGWGGHDATVDYFFYSVLLVKNEEFVIFNFRPIEGELARKYEDSFNENPLTFTDNFFKKIRNNNLESDIQIRIDLFKKIASTFKFIEKNN